MVLCGVRVDNRSLSAVRPAMSRRAETVKLRDTVPRRSTRVLAKLAEWDLLVHNDFLTVTDFGGQSMKPRESKPPQVSAMASLDFGE